MDPEKKRNLCWLFFIFAIIILCAGYSYYRLLKYGTTEDLQRAREQLRDPLNGPLAP